MIRSLGYLVLLPFCLWDYDTIEMERQRFPSALELITGKFLRHTEPYYRWRIADRTKRLEQSPNDLALYDDIAVAWDKLGDHEEAITVIQRKMEREQGEGYESHANLGTFLIHAGRFEEGLVHIRKAIEINPNAHFGREIIQQLLVEYLLGRAGGMQELPLEREVGEGFPQFVRQRAIEPQAAVKGILGMMRFGNHRSPILLEALGHLLVGDLHPKVDAKRLATRAFLKAAQETADPVAKEKYRRLAQMALSTQTPAPGESKQLGLASIEKALEQEVADARQWFARLTNRERGWIDAGVDVDEEFAKVYYSQPVVKTTPRSLGPWWKRLNVVAGLMAVGILIGAFALRRALSARAAG